MKATGFILALAVLAVPAVGASALELPGLGVRTSMEITVPSGARDYYGNGAGFTAGLVYNLPVHRNISFEPGLMYYYSTMSGKENVVIDSYMYQDNARFMGLRIPLMASYNVSVLPNIDLSFATGPWININLYARQNILPNLAAPVPVPDRRISLFDHGWKRVDAQWGFRLSMTFAGSYYVGITGGVSFTPLASFGNRDKKIRIHRNTIAVSLGYNF